MIAVPSICAPHIGCKNVVSSILPLKQIRVPHRTGALRLRNDRMIAIERRKMIAILADGEMNPFLLRFVPRKIAKQIASLR